MIKPAMPTVAPSPLAPMFGTWLMSPSVPPKKEFRHPGIVSGEAMVIVPGPFLIRQPFTAEKRPENVRSCSRSNTAACFSAPAGIRISTSRSVDASGPV